MKSHDRRTRAEPLRDMKNICSFDYPPYACVLTSETYTSTFHQSFHYTSL